MVKCEHENNIKTNQCKKCGKFTYYCGVCDITLLGNTYEQYMLKWTEHTNSNKHCTSVFNECFGKNFNKTDRDPDFRLRYKKTLKQTGSPIVVWDLVNNTEYTTDSFELKNCDIKMFFGNAIKQEKTCGATTILEVWKNEF